jgi:hypothetical protein
MPLWAYLIGTLVLALLVTSPFTVGSGVEHIANAIVDRFENATTWCDEHPLNSWSIVGGFGFLLTSLVLLGCLNDKVTDGWLLLPYSVACLFVAGVLEAMFWTLPTTDALYAAFIAAGGAPAALNFIATSIIVIFANAVHLGIFFGFMVGLTQLAP